MGLSETDNNVFLRANISPKSLDCPLRVWVVDDDEDVLFIQREKLHLLNIHLVECFSHGREALDALNRRVESGEDLPDVIFLDLLMPVMNGEKFLAGLTDLYPLLPEEITVILTSNIEPESFAGHPLVDSFILKPIPFPQLRRILKDSLAQVARRLAG